MVTYANMKISYLKINYITVQPGYDVMKGPFRPLQTSVVLTQHYNVPVNSEEACVPQIIRTYRRSVAQTEVLATGLHCSHTQEINHDNTTVFYTIM
jgi:hypothetical protein